MHTAMQISDIETEKLNPRLSMTTKAHGIKLSRLYIRDNASAIRFLIHTGAEIMVIHTIAIRNKQQLCLSLSCSQLTVQKSKRIAKNC